MLNPSRFNYLIEITQKLIAAVVTMKRAYQGFPALIEEEHKMIFAHTYTSRLEEICKEKTKLSDLITVTFEEMQQLAQQVYQIWGDVDCEGTAIYPGDLSNCIQMIESIHAALLNRQPNLASNVLALQIARLKEEFASFSAVSKEVKPKIELNKSSLSGIVRSYQDSTRVLVELCEQAQATYSASGTQNKLASGTSTIFVKA